MSGPLTRQYTVRLRRSGVHVYRTTSVIMPSDHPAADAVRFILTADGALIGDVTAVWEWPLCDYCADTATRYQRDSGEPLCWPHAVEHHDTATSARRATGELGVTRLTAVPRGQWSV